MECLVQTVIMFAYALRKIISVALVRPVIPLRKRFIVGTLRKIQMVGKDARFIGGHHGHRKPGLSIAAIPWIPPLLRTIFSGYHERHDGRREGC